LRQGPRIDIAGGIRLRIPHHLDLAYATQIVNPLVSAFHRSRWQQ